MRTQRKTKTINLELGGRVVSVKAVRANLPQGTQGYAGLNYNLRVYSGSDNSGGFNRDPSSSFGLRRGRPVFITQIMTTARQVKGMEGISKEQ